jgi:hypothetical protein
MNPPETRGWRDKARKVAIVLIVIGSLLPPLSKNIGAYARQAGLSGTVLKLDRPFS